MVVNSSKMRDFLTDKEHRRMVFIKGSVHQNHIDAPFIFKSVTIKKIIGKKAFLCVCVCVCVVLRIIWPDPNINNSNPDLNSCKKIGIEIQ